MSLPALLAADEYAIGEGWLQGRTAYGGASAAIALHAAMRAVPDLPPLRSAQIAFVGPLSGAVTATPTLLRRGKNSAFVAVDVATEHSIGLRALFLFMASRPSSVSHASLAPPPHGDPEADLVDSGTLPQGFLQNFDLTRGPRTPGSVLRWARLRERGSLDPFIELIAIADALPPAAMTLIDGWGPISTTTWQLNLVTDAPATRDGWWLLEAKTLHAADGNSSQSMTIWNRDGSPIATATQSVALFV